MIRILRLLLCQWSELSFLTKWNILLVKGERSLYERKQLPNSIKRENRINISVTLVSISPKNVSQSWHKRPRQGIFNMLTGGEISHQLSQIPHHSLVIALLFSTSNFTFCFTCSHHWILRPAKSSKQSWAKVRSTVTRGANLPKVLRRHFSPSCCQSRWWSFLLINYYFFTNYQLAVKIGEMTFLLISYFFTNFLSK